MKHQGFALIFSHRKVSISLFLICSCLIITSCYTPPQAIITADSDTMVVGNPQENLRYDYAGTLTAAQMEYLTTNFDWNKNLIVINYNRSDENCDINYGRTVKVKERYDRARLWWDNFYDNVATNGAYIVHVEEDSKYGPAFSTFGNDYFYDQERYVVDKIFRNARGCEMVLVANKQGDFFQRNSHYSKEQVANYIARLNYMMDPDKETTK
ncbi:hypothetical protein [Nonlabens ponticola]|uniref:Uncharacterized protein n=1 Tax=Nonlabens ponticola TaxID=2496866 RepID=A0A3S9MXU3_9FLAO|nr:hypothetical protein [Nonlabens ponticola]AZQ43952.1 hypothetical protein EJ995_06785 [Nonlabens ponticola]